MSGILNILLGNTDVLNVVSNFYNNEIGGQKDMTSFKRLQYAHSILVFLIMVFTIIAGAIIASASVSYTHLKLPTNREV